MTRRAPTDAEMRALSFGIKVCKHIKSNAIAFVAEDRTLAVGGGATSRIDPVYAAREKAARLNVSLEGSVLVSEALFPFPDGPTLAAEAGATAIAQPGGSLRDDTSDRGGRQVRARDGLHGGAPLPALAGARDESSGHRQRRARARAGLAAPSERDGVEDFLRERKSGNRSDRGSSTDRADRCRRLGGVREIESRSI